jgi:hypothetical protein
VPGIETPITTTTTTTTTGTITSTTDITDYVSLVNYKEPVVMARRVITASASDVRNHHYLL